MVKPSVTELISAASEANGNADIYLYAGPIYRPHDDRVMKALRLQRLRQNVILMLTTLGGDASAGYRISRTFQRRYKTGAYKPESKSDEARGKFTVFVDSICGSAGTVVALGADELIMSEFGELGPIDVQLRKPDDVMARSSGLTPTQALEILERQSQKLFKSHFRQLRQDPQLSLTTKTASDVAAKLTVGLLSQIYGQIDPMRLAEVERELRIAIDYGERLGVSNLKDDTLEQLTFGYPSHNFVIDRREARNLFKVVERPNDQLLALADYFRPMAEDCLNERSPLSAFLTMERDATVEKEPEEKGHVRGQQGNRGRRKNQRKAK